MARKPRIEYPGAFFHIIVRGNNREDIFRDRADYLRYLEKARLFLRGRGYNALRILPNAKSCPPPVRDG